MKRRYTAALSQNRDKRAFEVRVMWRRKGERKDRKIWAKDIAEARTIALKKFGPNRGVRPVENPIPARLAGTTTARQNSPASQTKF